MPESSTSLDTLPSFPTKMWGNMEARFFAYGTPLPSDVPITAGLVFAMREGCFLLADIEGRGWCTLGGHLEQGESVEEAVRREAFEEGGATLDTLHPLGAYLFYWIETGRHTLVSVFWAEVLTTASLPTGTESRGTAWVSRAELPMRYFYWDELMEAVFDYAVHCSSSRNLTSDYS